MSALPKHVKPMKLSSLIYLFSKPKKFLEYKSITKVGPSQKLIVSHFKRTVNSFSKKKNCYDGWLRVVDIAAISFTFEGEIMLLYHELKKYRVHVS